MRYFLILLVLIGTIVVLPVHAQYTSKIEPEFQSAPIEQKNETPITPIQSILSSANEHTGSGSPLITWDATGAVGIGIILFGIFGSITIVVFLKSKSRQKY